MKKEAIRELRRRSPGQWLTWVSVAALTANFCAGQSTQVAKKSAAADTAAQAKQTAPQKLTAEQEQGLRLLKTAAAEAAGLGADMRAFVLWRASYAYATVDSKKAESVSKESFTASESIDDPSDPDQCGPIGGAGDIKSWIQERVLSDMVRKGEIAEVEDLMPHATELVRNHVTRDLVKSRRRTWHAGKRCCPKSPTARNIHLTRPRACWWRWVQNNRQTDCAFSLRRSITSSSMAARPPSANMISVISLRRCGSTSLLPLCWMRLTRCWKKRRRRNHIRIIPWHRQKAALL